MGFNTIKSGLLGLVLALGCNEAGISKIKEIKIPESSNIIYHKNNSENKKELSVERVRFEGPNRLNLYSNLDSLRNSLDERVRNKKFRKIISTDTSRQLPRAFETSFCQSNLPPELEVGDIPDLINTEEGLNFPISILDEDGALGEYKYKLVLAGGNSNLDPSVPFQKDFTSISDARPTSITIGRGYVGLNPGGYIGSFIFEDGCGITWDGDFFFITDSEGIPEGNNPPGAVIFYPLTDRKILAGEDVPFVYSASDIDSDDMEYTLECGTGEIAEGGVSNLSFIVVGNVCNYPEEGRYTAIFTVDDKKGGTTRDHVDIIVSENSTPTVSFEQNSPLRVKKNYIANFSWVGNDFESPVDSLEYRLDCDNGNITSFSTEQTGECIYNNVGNYVARVDVRDVPGKIGNNSIDVEVFNDMPPTIEIIRPTNNPIYVNVGETFEIEYIVNDIDNVDISTHLICEEGSGGSAPYNGPPPYHQTDNCTFTSTGEYRIIIEAGNDDGDSLETRVVNVQ